MKTLTSTTEDPSFDPSYTTADLDQEHQEQTWQQIVGPYAKADVGRASISLATSVVPFVLLWAAMYFALDVSYLLSLALAVPASGFLLRTYILFHDCTHGSFLPSRRANAWLGTVLGWLVFTPFGRWRYEHAMHHATAGDLDRRFVGDVPTYTVAEYRSWSLPTRIAYRLYRNPAVMFGLGPIYAMVLEPRWACISKPRLRRSVWGTNLALVGVIGGLCLLIGWQNFLLIEAPFVFLSGGVGIWLFYVQHQFDDVYWRRTEDWSYRDAALMGSSYLKLPKILQFFTGNIGLHHVHHLSAKIPNYNLQRAHDQEAIFHSSRMVTLMDGVRATRLKLWDEDAGRMVTWRDLRQAKQDISPAHV
ncbi:MAG TPA: fatty acid desaturase [Acidimicrobiia bacterium]|nr:fatty acid desaturase [Acidimicrobiia bacterium]